MEEKLCAVGTEKKVFTRLSRFHYKDLYSSTITHDVDYDTATLAFEKLTTCKTRRELTVIAALESQPYYCTCPLRPLLIAKCFPTESDLVIKATLVTLVPARLDIAPITTNPNTQPHHVAT